MSQLPANNIGQQLFYKELPDCMSENPAKCCTRDKELQKWYVQTPHNLWNTASNYEGEPPFNTCTDIAFARQCMTSQYYNYLSKNNSIKSQNQ